MGLKPGESVLLLSDVPGIEDWMIPHRRLANFLTRSLMVRQIFDFYPDYFPKNNFHYMTYFPAGQHGAEPPEGVAGKMREYDVILAITTYSISHTNAREQGSSSGARIASMPGLQPEMLQEKGPMAVDYNIVSKETRYLAELIDNASTARVEAAAGTDITFSLENRAGGADTGLLTENGQWGNLPAGEAFVAPVEGTAEGVLVVPGGWYEGLKEAMRLKFTNGYVSEISGGGGVGDYFRELLRFDSNTLRHRQNCAELGIGTNPLARDPQNTLESEKIKGTVHIGIGDSSHLGGKTESDLHEDFVIPEATLYLDKDVILKEGKMII